MPASAPERARHSIGDALAMNGAGLTTGMTVTLVAGAVLVLAAEAVALAVMPGRTPADAAEEPPAVGASH